MTLDDAAFADTLAALDRVVSDEAVESNCLFQLAVMMARIALEPSSEAYVDRAEQAMLGLLRSKPRGNVVRLFGTAQALPQPTVQSSRLHA